MKRLLLGAIALALAAPAWADEVTLRSGGKIVGRVVADKPDSITLEVGGGRVTINKADIVEFRPGRTAFDDFDEKLIDIDLSGGAKDFYELGAWARERGLPAKARSMFQRAVDKDPNHEGARRALGFVRRNDQWLTREELNLAIGLVRVGGEWMTKAELEYRDLDRIEKKLRKMEADFDAALEAAARPREVVYVVESAPRYPIVGIQPALGYEMPRFFPYYYYPPAPTFVVNVNGGGGGTSPAPAVPPPVLPPPAGQGPVSATGP